MDIRAYRSLPQEAVLVRTKVFVEEQGFKNEFDEIDGSALHLVAFEGKAPIGTCRLFFSAERDCFVLGRLAVLKAGRGEGVGQALVRECERCVRESGGDRVELLAQVGAQGLYEKLGFRTLDERCDDEGCPHVWMRKDLLECLKVRLRAKGMSAVPNDRDSEWAASRLDSTQRGAHASGAFRTHLV